jgi:uncharacterized protein YdhG (YjbR/CyaY superfamily)
MIEREAEDELRRALAGRLLPPTIERWRVVIPRDAPLNSHEAAWAGALVLVERGTLRVVCRGGGERSFRCGSLLALDWLPLLRLSSDDSDSVSLLALRRATIHDPAPTGAKRGPRAMPEAAPKPARRSGPKQPPPADIDAYLAPLPPDQRDALQTLREVIHAAVPEATEVISYSAPAFRHHGMLVSFTAARNHCTFHLMGTDLLPEFADELGDYTLTKGGVHFTPDHPIPAELVTRMVRAKAARNEATAAKERQR